MHIYIYINTCVHVVYIYVLMESQGYEEVTGPTTTTTTPQTVQMGNITTSTTVPIVVYKGHF